MYEFQRNGSFSQIAQASGSHRKGNDGFADSIRSYENSVFQTDEVKFLIDALLERRGKPDREKVKDVVMKIMDEMNYMEVVKKKDFLRFEEKLSRNFANYRSDTSLL